MNLSVSDENLWVRSQNIIFQDRGLTIERGAFVDSKRCDRKIPYKIYLPQEEGLYPVIIWSHGLGGSRDGAGFISRFLASHGYAVVHIQHLGTDSSLWEGKDGHPWDVIRNTRIPRKSTLSRFQDVPFVLDQLKIWKDQNPDQGQKMNLSTLGMSGHSFGALTTQMMAGQKRGTGKRLYDLWEPRFKAGIVYSPVPVRKIYDGSNINVYQDFKIPLFFMTGTKDSSPVEGFDYTERLHVYEGSQGPSQHILIKQGGDHMVYNGSRGKLEENPKRATHEKIVQIASLAFWDAYLNDNKNAHQWLTRSFAAWLGDEGQYEFRNDQFKNDKI
jgi:dienelactone hydrolase